MESWEESSFITDLIELSVYVYSNLEFLKYSVPKLPTSCGVRLFGKNLTAYLQIVDQ